MPDKQLIIKTNWRYYFKHIVWGVILSPFLIGFIILIYVYIRTIRQVYIVTDELITDQYSGTSIQIDSIIEVKKRNPINRSNLTVHDLELISNDMTVVLKGIQNAPVIKESIEQLIAFKNELKESEQRRYQVQIKQDPGSLERLNDLAGLLQQGLISYEDYLQERKKFEDN